MQGLLLGLNPMGNRLPQIHPGHYIFEGRKPALLDSLVQAFAVAPLFVFFELLFLLGGRRSPSGQLRCLPSGGSLRTSDC